MTSPQSSYFVSFAPRITRVTVTALAVLLFFLYGNQAEAYFKPTNDVISPKTAKFISRNQTDAGIFSISLNQLPANKKNIFSRYTAPPLDTIATNSPVYNALHNPIVQEESIEATLYANIKLRRTIQDYLLIQEKAKEFLQDLERQDSELHGIQEANGTPITLNNLQQRMLDITNEFKGLIQKAGAIAKAASVNPPQKEKDGFTGANLVTAASPPAHSTQQAAANFYLKEIILSGTNSTLNSSQYSQANYSSRQPHNFEQEVTLPWIIRVPLNIFQYLMSHGIEALIYGALALIIISILSAMRAGK